MKRLTNRRTVLIGAGVATVVATSGHAAAQSVDIQGTVTFDGGAVIPKGRLEIYLDDPALQGGVKRHVGGTSVKSDGKSKAIPFSLPPPAGSAASPTLRIVARLERADGWLLARASTQFAAGPPFNVALNAVLY